MASDCRETELAEAYLGALKIAATAGHEALGEFMPLRLPLRSGVAGTT